MAKPQWPSFEPAYARDINDQATGAKAAPWQESRERTHRKPRGFVPGVFMRTFPDAVKCSVMRFEVTLPNTPGSWQLRAGGVEVPKLFDFWFDVTIKRRGK